MKKIISVLLFAMVLAMGSVTAGSIEDLDYNDRFYFSFNTDRQTDDYDVTIDADTLEGYHIGDILSTTELQVQAVTTQIRSEEEARTDAKGWGGARVMEYLDETFFPMLSDLFVTKDDLAISEGRIVMGSMVDTDEVCIYARQLRAIQTGNPDYKIVCHGFKYSN